MRGRTVYIYLIRSEPRTYILQVILKNNMDIQKKNFMKKVSGLITVYTQLTKKMKFHIEQKRNRIPRKELTELLDLMVQ